MSTRIHTKVITAIAAAAMVAAVVAPCASADTAKGTQIQIPPALSHLQEPGSTGWVPPTRVVIPPALSHLQEPGSTGWVPQGVSSQLSAGDLARGDALNKRYHLGIYSPAVEAGRKPVDPLAVGYLIGQGLSPSEVTSWTTGACSHQVKAASCYAVLNRSAATSSPHIGGSSRFQWGDAGIGAGFTLGIVILLVGAGAGLLISRQNRRHHTAHA